MASFTDSESDEEWAPGYKVAKSRPMPLRFSDAGEECVPDQEVVKPYQLRFNDEDFEDYDDESKLASSTSDDDDDDDDSFVSAISNSDTSNNGTSSATTAKKKGRISSAQNGRNSQTNVSANNHQADGSSSFASGNSSDNPSIYEGASPQEPKSARPGPGTDSLGNTTEEIFSSSDDLEEEEGDAVGALPLKAVGSRLGQDIPKGISTSTFITSTPMVSSKTRAPGFADLNLTAIPASKGLLKMRDTSTFQSSSSGSSKEVSPSPTSSPEWSPSKPKVTTKGQKQVAKGPSPPVATSSKRASPPQQYDDVENLVVDALHNITLTGSKKFQFKKKQPAAKPEQPMLGATCGNYFDEEEEEEEDEDDQEISANFSFDKNGGGREDSDLLSPEVQVLEQRPRPMAQTKGVDGKGRNVPQSQRLDDSDDLQVLVEKIKEIPLGQKGNKAPSRAIFLDEPPPIERPPVYAYDPLNKEHQEFYGDVQRTVSQLGRIIENMPLATEDLSGYSAPRGLVQLYDHQRFGLKWLNWREGEFPGGGILADEMGLGKTIMIIALIMKSKSEARPEVNEPWINPDEERRLVSQSTLVVCPVGCLRQWEEEIQTKGKGLKVLVYHGPHRTTSAAELARSDVVLSTYSIITHDIPKDGSRQRNRSPLARINWLRIVLDEAHQIRNPKTAGAQAICQLYARHRWAVTGTPIHNKPEDMFSMAKFLKMAPFDDKKVWDFWIGLKMPKAQAARDRLNIIGKSLMLRRTKAEVESMGGNVRSIPPKVVLEIPVELSEEERRVYDHLQKFAQTMFKNFMLNKDQRAMEMQAAAMAYTKAKGRKNQQEGDAPDDIRFSHLFALICRMRQCAVHPHLIETMLEEEDVDEDDSFDEFKDEHIVSKRNPIFSEGYQSSKFRKILEDVIELRVQAESEGRRMDKIVIVSSWTAVLATLNRHFREKGFSAVFITGKENMDDRMIAMKKFNENPGRPQICLLSLAAGGVGLNLIGGNHVFFVEPHWNPQLELQAQDRVHRFGQTKNVFIRRYISQETIEQRVMELQNSKMDLATGLLNHAKQTTSGGLSIPQMRLLFN